MFFDKNWMVIVELDKALVFFRFNISLFLYKSFRKLSVFQTKSSLSDIEFNCNFIPVAKNIFSNSKVCLLTA